MKVLSATPIPQGREAAMHSHTTGGRGGQPHPHHRRERRPLTPTLQEGETATQPTHTTGERGLKMNEKQRKAMKSKETEENARKTLSTPQPYHVGERRGAADL